MAVEVFEIPESRGGIDNEQIDFRYRVKGTSDEAAVDEAMIAFITTAGTTYESTDVTLYWDTKVKRNPVKETIYGDADHGTWLCTMSFVLPENVDPDAVDPDGEYSFETSGATAHITQSKATVDSIGNSPGAPDFKGAIGVDGKGKVLGVDIVVPTSSFSITKDQPSSLVTEEYRATTIPNLVTTLNNAAFQGYEIGEVMLEGVSGSRRGTVGDWRLTYRFLVSKDVAAISIDNISGTIDKAGWDYLWILYAEEEDAAAKRVVKRPHAAYTEQVYDQADFSVLGL